MTSFRENIYINTYIFIYTKQKLKIVKNIKL